MADKDKLTPKEELWCQEMLIDNNGTAACRRAGYRGSDKVLGVYAVRLLAKPRVALRLNALREQRAAKVRVDAEWVLTRLMRLADADISKAYKENGELKPIHEIPDEVRYAIGSVETLEVKDNKGNVEGYTQKVKFSAKEGALSLIGRHIGFFNDKLEIVDKSLAEKIAKGRARAAGKEGLDE